ncbi:MAG TPA: hypothetical protein VHE35_00240 [Kofleriaceae bacterium]|nr:hypothetical protein [Kofleriaceae bacterium]
MRCLILTTLLGLAVVPRAARAGDIAVNIGLLDDGTGTKIPSVAGVVPPLTEGDVLVVTCPAPAAGGAADCKALAVAQGTTTLKAKDVAAPSPWRSTPLTASSQPLTISYGDKLSVGTTVKATGAGTGATRDPGGGDALSPLRPACPGPTPAHNEIYVDTLGDVLAADVADFDEDATLSVWVFGAAASVDAIHVERRSAFRDVTVLRIQGNPAAVVTGAAKESGGPGQPEVVCKHAQLADFSPGRGQFALVGADNATVAEFELAVRPIFDGMFTVGFVGTWLVDRSFSLRSNGATSTIVEDPAGDVEGRFALMYTAFLPLSKLHLGLPRSLDRRLGASVGVMLDDPIHNLLFGANIGPFNGLSFAFGGHFGKVTALDGVEVGDQLAPDATIPTRSEWQRDWYVGASIDISVATRLFFTGFGR